MNIIINEKIHNELQKNIICTIEFGSALKGQSNEKSDRDLLHIVKSADWWVSLPVANQHLFQYKTDDTDHIYCNAHTFVKSILDGDTTIFIEMHQYGALNGTILEFLSKYNLTYYRTLRAYLGVARRDLKDIKKLWKTQNYRKMNKKFKFIQQSINLVISEINSQVHSDIAEFEYQDFDSKLIDTEAIDYFELENVEKYLIKLLEEIRVSINEYVQSNKMKKTISTEQFLDVMSGLSKVEIHKNIMENIKDEITSHFFNSYVCGF